MELDPTKSRNGPPSSEKNWNGRSKKPLLLFMEGVKFSRSWPLELDLMKGGNSPLDPTKFVRGRR
ncbi:hypothetical protein UE46_06055 [Listeria weihenstephanensis]|uniref:Uncharacterized protein n=1 Tax=Listeria weihenstephanensis TaxID=1006155 RepID=A0A1S7FT53_9LIST|nr:hypothetical protein UE46_06055 [Listeria weihenstephanensis]